MWLLLLCSLATPSLFAEAAIQPHKDNFYLFSKEGEVFYPYAANLSVLMQPEFSEAEVKDTLSRLAAGGINTVRVVIDRAFTPDAPLTHYEQFDGSLHNEIIDRLDTIVSAAEQYGVYVIVCLFDLQRIAAHWDEHPHNKKNGGSIQTLHDYLTNSRILARSLQRAKQVVGRFQGRHILAWEVARGADVWSPFQGLGYKPVKDYVTGVYFWLYRLLSTIEETDQQGHLTAITISPNTLPDPFKNLPFDVHFLQIVSSQTPEHIVQSVPQMLESARQLKKPVFVVEQIWNVPNSRWEAMNAAGFWSALASNSAAFFTAEKRNGLVDLHPSEYRMLENARIFLYHVNLAGRPRPPLEVPARTFPQGSYLIAQSMVGNDWLYWILRKNPGESKARVNFRTIEGRYEFFWMDIEEGIRGEPKEFQIKRPLLQMDSPAFQRSIIGRLRLLESFRKKKDLN